MKEFHFNAELARLFPFWTERQLDRITASCKEQGALLTGNYNQDGRDRTIWYTVADAVLDCYDISGSDQSVECNAPVGEMHSTDCVDASHEPVKSYKEQLLTPVISPHKPPEGDGRASPGKDAQKSDPHFDRFWTAYPRKVDKDRARRAWKRLKVTDALLEAILAGLERDRRSSQWTKDCGQFIPYPATWLNNRRWEAEPAAKPPDQGAPPVLSAEEAGYIDGI